MTFALYLFIRHISHTHSVSLVRVLLSPRHHFSPRLSQPLSKGTQRTSIHPQSPTPFIRSPSGPSFSPTQVCKARHKCADKHANKNGLYKTCTLIEP